MKTDHEVITLFVLQQVATLMLTSNWGKNFNSAFVKWSKITEALQKNNEPAVTRAVVDFIKFHHRIKPKKQNP